MSSLFPSQVIVSALLTEKASLVGQSANTYVFKVTQRATKLDVKKAIEKKFNVSVTNVNLLNVKGKLKRGGKGKLTKKSDWKKAYISLKAEDRIEISQD
jgi:large subunit ribosomal protein L23|tara:strand:+ start:3419 stop:3715 length:297 start_codon:yes stop_codon:yes gene_type:complete